MMPYFKKLFFCLGVCFICHFTYAQNNPPTIAIAGHLYQRHQYKKSAQAYFDAFGQDDNLKTDDHLFEAAKACAQGGYADSAFKYLHVILTHKNRRLLDEAEIEPDFESLYRDKRWKMLENETDMRPDLFNRPIAADLVSMYTNRLHADLQRSQLLEKYGAGSRQYKTFRDSVLQVDSDNVIRVRSIVNTYGWPGIAEVGRQGVAALEYLFQRMDYQTQRHYFPLVELAYKRGTITPDNFAIIADRVSLLTTGKQLYGTQQGKAIANPDSLAARRHSIGLDTVRSEP